MKKTINTVILGDCVKVLKDFDAESIACCITDPPYNYEFIGKDWNNEEIIRRVNHAKKNSSILVKNIPYGSGLAGGIRNKRWYEKNRKNIIDYQKWIELWGAELFRILKPGSYILVFNSSRTIAHVQVALENVGFYARDIIVWRRNSGIPKGINIKKKLETMGDDTAMNWEGWHSCLRNEWEAIAVLQKPLINNYIQTIKRYNVGLLYTKSESGFQSNIIENIKRDIQKDFNIHPTVKPIDLMEKLIKLTVPKDDNNIILDPFSGSGTTLVAAKKLGFNYIGIEINQTYIEISNKRLLENVDI